MSVQVFGFKPTVCASLLHLQVDMHDVLGKIRASGKELLALCTLVLPLGFAMSLSNVLLQVFHHLKALGALTPLIQMHGAHVLLQCSACGAPGVTLVAGKVSHFEVDKLAVAVQVLDLFSTIWARLLHAKVNSLQVVPQVGLVLKSLLAFRTDIVPLLLMDNPDVAGKAVHPDHLLALRASQLHFVVNTFHVFPQVKATCKLCLAVFLRTGERQILLVDKTLVLFHVCHFNTTLWAGLCPFFDGSVGSPVLLQRERCEKLLVAEVTLHCFLLLVLDPEMSFHVKGLLSTDFTLEADFVLVFHLHMPGEMCGPCCHEVTSLIVAPGDQGENWNVNLEHTLCRG